MIAYQAGSEIAPRPCRPARVKRDGQTYAVALADLTFDADSQVERIVSAYRRWQGHTP